MSEQTERIAELVRANMLHHTLEDTQQEVIKDLQTKLAAMTTERDAVEHFWFDVGDGGITVVASQEEAIAKCSTMIDNQTDGCLWGMDEDDLTQFIVGTITHRAVIHRHIGTDDECESLGFPRNSEIWHVKLESMDEQKPYAMTDERNALQQRLYMLESELAIAKRQAVYNFERGAQKLAAMTTERDAALKRIEAMTAKIEEFRPSASAHLITMIPEALNERLDAIRDAGKAQL